MTTQLTLNYWGNQALSNLEARAESMPGPQHDECLLAIDELRPLFGSKNGSRTLAEKQQGLDNELAARIAALEAEVENLRQSITEWAAEARQMKSERDAERQRAEQAEGVLESLRAWALAYPVAVFPEPDFAKAHELLQAGDITLDAISASTMRHTLAMVLSEIERAATPAPRDGTRGAG